MEIHCFQYETAWEDPAETIRRIDALVSNAAVNAGDLLVFPELSTVGFSMEVDTIAEPIEGISFQYFSKLANRLQCSVIAGIPGRNSSTGLGLNDAVCFGPDGSETSRYRKVHPFPLSNEGDHYEPGTEAKVVDVNGWKVAPMICYDLRFPELFRSAVSKGAELFIVIANWPNLREDHWLTLLQARAIENQAFVAGVNRCGSDPTLNYSGASLIVDPKGTILSKAGAGTEVLHAELDHSVLSDWRTVFPALADMKLTLAQ